MSGRQSYLIYSCIDHLMPYSITTTALPMEEKSSHRIDLTFSRDVETGEELHFPAGLSYRVHQLHIPTPLVQVHRPEDTYNCFLSIIFSHIFLRSKVLTKLNQSILNPSPPTHKNYPCKIVSL